MPLATRSEQAIRSSAKAQGVLPALSGLSDRPPSAEEHFLSFCRWIGVTLSEILAHQFGIIQAAQPDFSLKLERPIKAMPDKSDIRAQPKAKRLLV